MSQRHLRGGQAGPVGLQACVLGVDRGLGRVDRALRDEALRQQFARARQLAPGIGQLRLGPGDLGPQPGCLGLLAARVEREQQLALAHLLAFLHMDLRDQASQLRPELDRRQRRDGAAGVERAFQVAPCGFNGGNRHWRSRSGRFVGLAGFGLVATTGGEHQGAGSGERHRREEF